MKSTIEIKYRNISREILKELETKLDKSIRLEVLEDTADHLESPAEIVFNIDEQLTELIMKDRLLTGGIEDGIKTLWKKIKKENSIELNFKFPQDRTIEFDFVGNVNPSDIDIIAEQMVEYLKNTEQQKKDFVNPDYKQQEDVKPRLRLRFNPVTAQLEVVNFIVVRKQMAEAFKRIAAKLKGN